MFEQAIEKKEVMQWGYVALISIALAITSLVGTAASSTRSVEMKSTSESPKWDACLSSTIAEGKSERQLCEVSSPSNASDYFNRAIHSALVNIEPNRMHPMRDHRVY